MCRILAYLGHEIPLENLLLRPENSLINQSRAPKLHPLMQLAGWGVGAWSEHFHRPEQPLIYRRPTPAFFDDNAVKMLPSLQAHTALAHVRAASYRSETVLADENCHPFSFRGTPWIMVHNGSIPAMRLVQQELSKHSSREFLQQVRGTTDSEFFFCLLMSLLNGDDSTDNFQASLEKALTLLVATLKAHQVEKSVKLKVAFASPHDLIAVNYGADFDGSLHLRGDWQKLRQSEIGSRDFLRSTILEPLYLLQGHNFHLDEDSYDMHCGEEHEIDTIILASEPLTERLEDWREVPFGSMLRIQRKQGQMERETRQLFI